MNHNGHKFRVTVNGQDVTTGDIDDGRPERILVPCKTCGGCGFIYVPALNWTVPCKTCKGCALRDETDEEYWARVEAMTPKSADDLL